MLVTPRTEPLPRIALTGRWAGAGDDRTRELVGGGSPDVTIREYRLGDDLRRIHWPSSARTDELMVRREEQQWQSRCTLLLDNRRVAHRGYGTDSSMETRGQRGGIDHAPLVALDFEVRLVTATGNSSAHGWRQGARGADPARAARAARAPRDDPPRAAVHRMGRRVAAGRDAARGPRPPGERRPRVPGRAGRRRRLGVRRGAGRRRPGTASGPAEPPATASLRTGGWKATTLERDGSLAAAWQELAR